MKKVIENFLPRIKKFSKRLNDETALKNQQWILIDETGLTTITYIFRDKNQLLISKNGNVVIGAWEYLTSDKILLNFEENTYLYRNEYFDDKLLALKKDGAEIYSLFINEEFLNSFNNDIGKIESFIVERYNKIEENNHNQEIRKIVAEPERIYTKNNNESSGNSNDIVFFIFWIAIFIFFLSIIYFNVNSI